jgi:hypothetical protein
MDLVVSARTPRAIAGRVFTTIQRRFAVRFARWADLPVVILVPSPQMPRPTFRWASSHVWLGD